MSCSMRSGDKDVDQVAVIVKNRAPGVKIEILSRGSGKHR